MTPLPSIYKGYHCRSRLEARWLCFLDTLGMQFIYEPEGFKFEDGTCYLPDLYFPVIETWGEIKPVPIEPRSPEDRKITNLVVGSGRPLIILEGPPEFRSYTERGLSLPPETAEWEVSLDIHMYAKYYFHKHDGKPRLFTDPPATRHADYSDEYSDAVYTSRQLRFESL